MGIFVLTVWINGFLLRYLRYVKHVMTERYGTKSQLISPTD